MVDQCYDGQHCEIVRAMFTVELVSTQIISDVEKQTDMGMSSILVAVQGAPSDREAVKLACGLLDSRNSKLHIVHVIEVAREFHIDAEIASAANKGEHILKQMEDLATLHKCRPEAKLVQARQAGLAVVREAVEKNVDTIVLGVPYRKRFGDFTLGETTSYVLENAPCCVILWRESTTPHYTE